MSERTEFTVKEVEEALNEFVERGYLKRVKKNGKVAYKDSDEVTKLLKEGKSRKEISKILDAKHKGKRFCLLRRPLF